MRILCNPGSGTKGRDDLGSRLRHLLSDRVPPVEVHVLEPGQDIREVARRLVEVDDGPLVAAGGDGTVSAVASVLVGRDRTFGVLPCGTLNHFAKDLGIPLALEDAVRVLEEDHTAPIDVGEVNGSTFVNNSSFGLYPSFVSLRRRHDYLPKWLAAVPAVLHSLRLMRIHEIEVAISGRTIRRRSPLLFVGNNRYQMENRDIGTRARLDEGVLSVFVAHDRGALGLLGLAFRMLRGTLYAERDFDAFSTTRVTVHLPRSRLTIANDGETHRLSSPLVYRVLPGALRVLVPRPGEAQAVS